MGNQQQAKRRRGRPPVSGGGAISGYGKGVRLTWTDGLWRGTDRLVREAEALSTSNVSLPVFDGAGDVLALIVVDRYDPCAAVAIIQAVTDDSVHLVGDLPLAELGRLAEFDIDDYNDERGGRPEGP